MPKSKIFLPDVNVWLALASERHVHSGVCGSWLNRIEAGSTAFCRITQMGLLRLLTNSAVMQDEVLSSSEAWFVYRRMLTDERISFQSEPPGLEDRWRKLTSRDKPAPKLWTDAYLAAFAEASGLQIVTLDGAVLALAPEALVLR